MRTAGRRLDTGDGSWAQMLGQLEEAMPEVRRYAARRVAPHDVDEVMAEVVHAALESCRRYGSPDIATGWLVRVARNKIIDRWRRVERERTKLEIHASQTRTTNPGSVVDTLCERVLLSGAMAELSPRHQVALRARYIEGASVSEVADTLGITYRAAESLLSRARIALRQSYLAIDADAL